MLGAHGIKSAIAGGGYNANIWTYFANEYHIGADNSAPTLRILNTANGGIMTHMSSVAPTTVNASEVSLGGGRVLAYAEFVSQTNSFYTPNNQGLYIGGTFRLYGDVNYTHVKSPSGVTKIYTGNTDSYYDNGSHHFRNAAGTGDGDVYAGNVYRNGSLQPQSTVTFINVNGSTYLTLTAIPDNSMWELTVGNATDGYTARAILGKPAAGVASVLLSEVHSNANLTISLSGDDIRINNGVGATRTMLYVLTRLY